MQPLFKIYVTLQNSKVEFKPSIPELTQTVNAVAKAAISTVGEMPRLSEALAEGDAALKEGRESFYEKISKDDDVLKVLVHVMTGMREILPRMVKYITTWDRYKHIWDVDKDAFMRRYAKANRALTAFETDIARYRELASDIQSEEGYSNIGFIRVDSGPLKQARAAARLPTRSPPRFHPTSDPPFPARAGADGALQEVGGEVHPPAQHQRRRRDRHALREHRQGDGGVQLEAAGTHAPHIPQSLTPHIPPSR